MDVDEGTSLRRLRKVDTGRKCGLLSQQLLSSGEEETSPTSPAVSVRRAPPHVKFACPTRAERDRIVAAEAKEAAAAAALKIAQRRITADDLIRKDIALADDSSDDGFASDDEGGIFSTPSESSFTSESAGHPRGYQTDDANISEDATAHIEAEAERLGVQGDTFALDEEGAGFSEYCRQRELLRPVSPSDIDPSFPSNPPGSDKHVLSTTSHDEREGDVIARGRSLPHRRRACQAIKIRIKKALDQSL